MAKLYYLGASIKSEYLKSNLYPNVRYKIYIYGECRHITKQYQTNNELNKW